MISFHSFVRFLMFWTSTEETQQIETLGRANESGAVHVAGGAARCQDASLCGRRSALETPRYEISGPVPPGDANSFADVPQKTRPWKQLSIPPPSRERKQLQKRRNLQFCGTLRRQRLKRNIFLLAEKQNNGKEIIRLKTLRWL